MISVAAKEGLHKLMEIFTRGSDHMILLTVKLFSWTNQK